MRPQETMKDWRQPKNTESVTNILFYRRNIHQLTIKYQIVAVNSCKEVTLYGQRDCI